MKMHKRYEQCLHEANGIVFRELESSIEDLKRKSRDGGGVLDEMDFTSDDSSDLLEKTGCLVGVLEGLRDLENDIK